MHLERILASCTLFLLVFTSSLTTSSGNRVKRIINGLELHDYDSGYSATQYFVWLSNTHFCGFFYSLHNLFLTFKLKHVTANRLGYYTDCDVNPQSYMCGGSLLTPTAVQSACHCFASVADMKDSPVKQRFIPKNGFDDNSVAFVGSTSTQDMEMKKGYISKSFIIHQKCTLGAKGRYLSHDFAIVVLKTPVTPDPTLHLAPVYRKATMVDMFYSIPSNENVCLFMGYGLYLSEEDYTASSVLRHCWAVIRNYVWCYHTEFWFVPAYKNTTTWYCTSSLPENMGFPNKGDSGSPVTCNNQYIGFVTAGYTDLFLPVIGFDYTEISKTNSTHVTANVFNFWQNAFEYRNDFEYTTEQLTKR